MKIFLIVFLLLVCGPTPSLVLAQGSTQIKITRVKATINGDTVLAESAKDSLKELYSDPKDCCRASDPTKDTCARHTLKDCSQNYCGDEECIKKIMCCHRVSEQIFDLMTDTRSNGFATFPRRKVKRIVKYADCQRQCIGLSTAGKSYYLNLLDAMAPNPDREHESFHSVALLVGIYDRGIRKIRLYKGFNQDDGTKIVPFSVIFRDGSSEYFNLAACLEQGYQ